MCQVFTQANWIICIAASGGRSTEAPALYLPDGIEKLDTKKRRKEMLAPKLTIPGACV